VSTWRKINYAAIKLVEHQLFLTGIVWRIGLAIRIDLLAGILFFSDPLRGGNGSHPVDTRQSPDEAEKFDAGQC
jgi:hypothetical protein